MFCYNVCQVDVFSPVLYWRVPQVLFRLLLKFTHWLIIHIDWQINPVFLCSQFWVNKVCYSQEFILENFNLFNFSWKSGSPYQSCVSQLQRSYYCHIIYQKKALHVYGLIGVIEFVSLCTLGLVFHQCESSQLVFRLGILKQFFEPTFLFHWIYWLLIFTKAEFTYFLKVNLLGTSVWIAFKVILHLEKHKNNLSRECCRSFIDNKFQNFVLRHNCNFICKHCQLTVIWCWYVIMPSWQLLMLNKVGPRSLKDSRFYLEYFSKDKYYSYLEFAICHE